MVDGIPMLMVWAVLLVVLAHLLLTRTAFGNWIFAAGGDAGAARNVGVPVNRVKILMFMLSGLLRHGAGRLPGARIRLGRPPTAACSRSSRW